MTPLLESNVTTRFVVSALPICRNTNVTVTRSPASSTPFGQVSAERLAESRTTNGAGGGGTIEKSPVEIAKKMFDLGCTLTRAAELVMLGSKTSRAPELG